MTLTEVAPTLVHTRAFEDAALDMKEGRLRGRLVPYDTPALVLDMLPNGQPDIYMEGFRTGAFERLLRDPKGNAGRLEFKHRHDGGLGYLGPGIEVEDGDDGFYASFQIVRSLRDDVADLIAAGHRGLSVEFRTVPGGTVEEDDVRWRTDVILSGVALEWRGAYSEAEVVAFRSELAAEHSDELELAKIAQKQADAEAAAQAAKEAAEAEAVERQRRQAEVDAWLEEQERRQAELAAKYG